MAILYIIGILVVIALVAYLWPLAVAAVAAWLAVKLIPRAYAAAYFRSSKFNGIKGKIRQYVRDSNDLNAHIEGLRSSYRAFQKKDYGEASFSKGGSYRKGRLEGMKYSPNVCECSSTVLDGARRQPFKYLCKYFGIRQDEGTLERFEGMLNDFSAAEDGKKLLKAQKDEIMAGISGGIPSIVKRLFPERLERELGFEPFEYNELYFPTYSFRYVSAGGRSTSQCDVTMDIPTLERFEEYLAEGVKFRKSAEGQRRLMTPALRRQIIERDDHTCQTCGNSTYREPNLLLEVDHIIPIARGGITTEGNLQTLCWKCNRSKGAKVATA